MSVLFHTLLIGIFLVLTFLAIVFSVSLLSVKFFLFYFEYPLVIQSFRKTNLNALICSPMETVLVIAFNNAWYRDVYMFSGILTIICLKSDCKLIQPLLRKKTTNFKISVNSVLIAKNLSSISIPILPLVYFASKFFKISANVVAGRSSKEPSCQVWELLSSLVNIKNEVDTESIKSNWTRIWKKDEGPCNFSRYLVEHPLNTDSQITFQSLEEFKDTIRFLPN